MRIDKKCEGEIVVKEYSVEVKFIDGTKVVIEVEAENEDEALDKAMPISLNLRN